MKAKLIFTGIVIMLFSVIWVGCKKNYNTYNTSSQIGQTKLLQNVSVNGVKLPNGTKAIRLTKSKVKFVFPKGIQLWYLDNNNMVQKMEESGYTCSCSSSGGCDVVLAKGEYGCMQGSCGGSCTGTPDKGIANTKLAFVDINQKIGPVKNQNEFNSLKYIPSFLLLDKQVRQILQSYAKNIYKNNADINKVLKYIDNHSGFDSDINSIIYVEIKMFGYKFIYGISVNDLTNEKSTNNLWEIAPPGGVKCKCESGSSGCTSGSVFGVKYCKGGSCTKCKMN
jgi:hypothetical protein